MSPRRVRAAVIGTLALLFSLFAATSPGTTPARAATVTVTNGVQFTDTSGAPVQAHGAGVIKVGSYYYLVGENRNADDSFRAVSVYRSTDLRTWEYRHDILTQASAGELVGANIERPKIIYNASTKQYVLWMHWEQSSTDYSQARTAVATSATVDGDYSYRGSFRPLGNESRDMTVFVDDDSSAYLISSARGNADTNVYRLDSTYTSVASLVTTLWPNGYREAPAMFKRGGVYFMISSTTSGWAPNQAMYASSSAIGSGWSGLSTVADSITYGSQSTFVLPVQGSGGTSYLYLGDRWAGAWGGPVNSSEYVWLPLAFPSATKLSMTWSPQISIDTAAGTVTGIGGGTPYSKLVAQSSGRCADVGNASRADNAAVIQYGCNGGANQAWQVLSSGGYVTLVNRNSHRCLDVNSASTADGTPIDQYACNGGTNQQFTLSTAAGGYVSIVARHSGKCVDVSGASAADGAAVVQWPCSGAANQLWSFRGL